MKAAALTHTGKVRSINQDYIFTSSQPVGALPNLFVVADGMGGHQAGDYASRFAVERLVEFMQESETGSPVRLLKDGIETINRKLYREALEHAPMRGMGTTLVACVVEEDTAYVANVGDSRLYLIRREAIQITRDHSYVEEMVSMGRMDRGSLDYQFSKNIITRAVGSQQEVQVDFFEVQLMPQDCLLLCSDGLTNMLGDDEIAQLTAGVGTLADKAEALIQAANEAGGKDNIAVVLVEPQISEVSLC